MTDPTPVPEEPQPPIPAPDGPPLPEKPPTEIIPDPNRPVEPLEP